jgi:excisionase family DNA binding protein
MASPPGSTVDRLDPAGRVGAAPPGRVRVTVAAVSLGRMLTRAEVADALGVTPRTVTELVRRRELPVYRFAGRPRFLRPDVAAVREARSSRTGRVG